MTVFEYLAAGYVLMLSFAVLRAMSGVPHALRSSRRYWVHVVWLISALFTCLVSFWAFWPYREVDWTIFRFMNALAIPTLLYGHISLLVPPDPSAVKSWRDYFFEVRIPLFGTAALFMTTVTISNQTSLGVSALHPTQLGNYAILAMYAFGLGSAKPRVHAGLALVFSISFAVYFLSLLSRPDSTFAAVP
jgi:hypothetical protein